MKILILSTLYPDRKIENIKRQTAAIHNFVKFWVNEADIEVLVVKLHYFPIDEKRFCKKPFYYRDEVPVESVYMYDKGIQRKKFQNFLFFRLWITGFFKKNNLEKFNFNNLKNTIERRGLIPDIILSHGMLSFREANLIGKYYSTPYIVGFHASDIQNFLTNNRWASYISKYSQNATALVARSFSIKKKLQENFPAQKNLFTAISGINPNFIIPIEDSIRKLKHWKRGKRPVRIISICTLIKLKNIDINLRALAALPSDLNFEYYIIGNGKELQHLKLLTEELNLNSKVRFMGKLEHNETLNELENSDIFVMVSSPETFGLSYLEAISKGNIVVGATNNGIHGIFEDKQEVLFVTPGNIKELHDCLVEVLYQKEEEELIAMIEKSHEHITNLSEKKVSQSYLNYLRQFLRT